MKLATCVLGLILATWICVIHAQVRISRPLDLNTDLADAYYSFAFNVTRPVDGEWWHSDVPHKIRHTFYFGWAYYEALVPYYPTLKSFLKTVVPSYRPRKVSRDRRTQRNVNIASIYAGYTQLIGLWPLSTDQFTHVIADQLSISVQDVKNKLASCSDNSAPECIGIKIGRAINQYLFTDGYNQLGDMEGRQYFRMNYSDPTGYTPANTAYHLTDVDRWQPNFRADPKHGFYTQEAHMLPQMASAKSLLSKQDRAAFVNSFARNYKAQINPRDYNARAIELINIQAALTDSQKMFAETIDEKLSIAQISHKSNAVLSKLIKPTIETDQQLLTVTSINSFLYHAAVHEAMLAVWEVKMNEDSIRPDSQIRHWFKGKTINAWAGPGKGIRPIDGRDFQPYIPTAPFSEYPSGTTCVIKVLTKMMEKSLGTNNFPITFSWAAGSSKVEPGVTPAQATSMSFTTLSDLAYAAGQSRKWGGVHFDQAVEQSHANCQVIADKVWSLLTAYTGTDIGSLRLDSNTPDAEGYDSD